MRFFVVQIGLLGWVITVLGYVNSLASYENCEGVCEKGDRGEEGHQGYPGEPGPPGEKGDDLKLTRLVREVILEVLESKVDYPLEDFKACVLYGVCQSYWSQWSTWSKCSDNCGPNSYKRRTRTCVQDSIFSNGDHIAPCEGSHEMRLSCSPKECPSDLIFYDKMAEGFYKLTDSGEKCLIQMYPKLSKSEVLGFYFDQFQYASIYVMDENREIKKTDWWRELFTLVNVPANWNESHASDPVSLVLDDGKLFISFRVEANERSIYFLDPDASNDGQALTAVQLPHVGQDDMNSLVECLYATNSAFPESTIRSGDAIFRISICNYGGDDLDSKQFIMKDYDKCYIDETWKQLNKTLNELNVESRKIIRGPHDANYIRTHVFIHNSTYSTAVDVSRHHPNSCELMNFRRIEMALEGVIRVPQDSLSCSDLNLAEEEEVLQN